uniref:hypothetical protein n=1 Tax=Halomonas sp. TaxID=1486246 RepID=UPI00260D9D57|nr:hypothetical protein [Halomonas sp.]
MAKFNVARFASQEEAIAHYLDQVDQAALAAKSDFTTIREVKWQEVLAGGGPVLRAEAEALGCTLAEVIQSVTVARKAWCTSEAAKESARIKAKAAIREAQSPADMHAAVQQYCAELAT